VVVQQGNLLTGPDRGAKASPAGHGLAAGLPIVQQKEILMLRMKQEEEEEEQLRTP